MYRVLLKLVRRRRLRRDLEAELAFHREMARAAGNDIPFGNSSVVTEQALDLWRFTFLENLWRDVVYGVRGLRRSPALVLSALLSLGLGIGVNTAMFSLAVEFLFSEPSVTAPGTVVLARLGGNSHVNAGAFESVAASGVFQDVAGENEEVFINWNDGTETRQLSCIATTKNFFTALGVPVAHGRGILPTDPDEVVVLQDRFWRKYFNADPSLVGRAMMLNGKAYTIVGILPASHRTLLGFGFAPDVYVPRYLDDTVLAIYGRLKPGTTPGQVRAALHTIGTNLDRESGHVQFGRNAMVTPIAGFARIQSQQEIMTIGVFFIILLALVGLVLLIACVNVASLLLARATARRREIAVRLSLGATRGRLLQQLLVESLLLAVLGAAAGVALAQGVASVLASVHVPGPLPVRLQIDPDWRVALYAAFLTLVATVACGLLPAWQAIKESIAADLPRDRKLRLRRGLVAGQVAVSLVVLATGFLFMRNLFRANALSPGFDVRNTIHAAISLPPATYGDTRRIASYVERGLSALRAIPAVDAVAAARVIPFTDSVRQGGDIRFSDNGEQVRILSHWNAVTPDFFRAMDIPVRAGRGFTETDRSPDNVVVVNTTFVRQYLNGRNPLNTVFLWGHEGNTPFRIVGVVEPTRNMTIGEEDRPQFYQPFAQINNTRTRIHFVLRSAIPPALQLDAVRTALREVEPGAGAEVTTLSSAIGLAFFPSQVGAALLGSIGLLGLTLAMVGLYGTMTYSVLRRSHEIAVRMAVGAGRRDIRRLVLREAMTLGLVGSAIGLGVAFFVTKPLAMFLISGLTPRDPVTLGGVVAALTLTGLVAAWGPLRRAVAVDPIVALRYE